MEHELNSLTVGHTKNINGHVVTRWSENSFEVDTWGRKTVTFGQALAAVTGSGLPFCGGPGSGKSWFPETYKGVRASAGH